MSELTAAEILAATDSSVELLETPEWGGNIYIRVMSGRDRDDLERATAQGNNLENARAKFAAIVVCDAQGKRLFDESQIADLSEKSSLVLDRIFDRGMRLNKMGDQYIEELVKKTDADPSGDSGLSSPAPSLAVVSEKPKSA